MEIFSLESLFAPSELENKKTDVALAVALFWRQEHLKWKSPGSN